MGNKELKIILIMSLLHEKTIHSLHEFKQDELFTQWVKPQRPENLQSF